jgi:hypothetical protein
MLQRDQQAYERMNECNIRKFSWEYDLQVDVVMRKEVDFVTFVCHFPFREC